MDRATLVKAMDNIWIDNAELEAFNEAMVLADVTTVARAVMWCAQLGHESVGLKYYEEIASGDDYEGREDLGNIQVGDGRRFKGRGPIQVTGRANYTALSKWAYEKGYVSTPDEFVRQPELLASVRFGFLGAVWYWTTQRPLNALSDARDVIGATRAINGGTNGLKDRQARYMACESLGAKLLPTTKEEVTMSNAQDVQEQLRGPGLRGWPAWLYGLFEKDQPRMSLVDFVRSIHQKMLSTLPVGDANNPRPRPLEQSDDMFGHILSLRAQVEELKKLLEDR